MRHGKKRYIISGATLILLLSLISNIYQSVMMFRKNTEAGDSNELLPMQQINNMGTDTVESSAEAECTFNGTKEDCDLYLRLLKSEIRFMNANDQRYLTLDEWKKRKVSTGAENIRYTYFSMVDMDGDRRAEVLVQEAIGATDIGTWVFRIEEQNIIRYHVSSRGMRSLKTDGTFLYSGGIYNYGIATVCFKNYQMDVIPRIYCETAVSELYEPVTTYYIESKETNEETFLEKLTIQSEKEDVLWFNFSDINIAKCFDNGEAP